MLSDSHLYESGCWVSPLLKVFLPVLLLNLQSKARAQNALKHRRQTGELGSTHPCPGDVKPLTAGRAKKETPIRVKVAASRRPFQVMGNLSP